MRHHQNLHIFCGMCRPGPESLSVSRVLTSHKSRPFTSHRSSPVTDLHQSLTFKFHKRRQLPEKDLPKLQPDRFQGGAVPPPVIVWCEQPTVITGRDDSGCDAAAGEDVVEDELGAAAVIGGGDHQQGLQVVFTAVNEGELGVGAGVGGAIEENRFPVLQVAVGAVPFGKSQPSFAVSSRHQNQLRSKLVIVQLQSLVQAAAVTVATEDDNGVSGCRVVANAHQLWQADNDQSDQQRGEEQAGKGAENEGAVTEHGLN